MQLWGGHLQLANFQPERAALLPVCIAPLHLCFTCLYASGLQAHRAALLRLKTTATVRLIATAQACTEALRGGPSTTVPKSLLLPLSAQGSTLPTDQGAARCCQCVVDPAPVLRVRTHTLLPATHLCKWLALPYRLPADELQYAVVCQGAEEPMQLLQSSPLHHMMHIYAKNAWLGYHFGLGSWRGIRS